MNLRRIRLAALVPMMLLASAPAAAATIQVIKSATCGCCSDNIQNNKFFGLVNAIFGYQVGPSCCRSMLEGVPAASCSSPALLQPGPLT